MLLAVFRHARRWLMKKTKGNGWRTRGGGGALKRCALASLTAGAASIGVFAQDPSAGGGVRQSIDSASGFLSGIIGILFIVFIVRGLLKKKKRQSGVENDK
jgi:hypothetical protein